MKCKNCFNLEKMKDYARGDVYDWCVVKHDNPDTDMERDCPFYKPITNYDRVISKTPEKLAEWIAGDVLNLTGGALKMATEAWADWLRKERK